MFQIQYWPSVSVARTSGQIGHQLMVLRLVHPAQGCSQPHSSGWAKVPLPQISINFSYFFSNFTYFLPHFGPPGGRLQGRSQPHSPGWARVPLSSFFPQILIIFSYFSSNFSHFLPHFGSPSGRFTHPGRPWLRHWATRPPEKALATPLGPPLARLLPDF